MNNSPRQHARRILSESETVDGVSQLALSRIPGIAHGLTNLLIRRLVGKGFVRVVQTEPNRVRYLLTPADRAEKARMSRQALQDSVQLCAELRERIRGQFTRLSKEWPSDGDDGEKNIVFYGAGEVAESAHVCLQETELRLVGVIDDRISQFFDVPVHRRHALCPGATDGKPFGRLIVTSVEDPNRTGAELVEFGFEREYVVWL